MRPSRTRLINAARRSMIQRTELQRKLGAAGEAFKPKSLYNRGKYRLGAKVDDTAQAVQKQLRNNRLPIALAAAAGIAWLLRDPIREHAPRHGRRLRDLAEAGLDKLRPDQGDVGEDREITEDQNEAAQ
ncbi:MAG: hypothetical protein ACT6Q3_11630 [Sphingopyxis sp.]